MTYYWIIHTGAEGNIHEKIILQTKHKHKVGKYIRENLLDVFFIFQKFCVCQYYGKIWQDLKYIHDDDEYNFYNNDDKEKIIEEISNVLENYTYEEIVDELYGSSSDSERDYACITKISSKDIIKL